MSLVNVQVQGQQELVRDLSKLAGPELRRLARRVSSDVMKPVLADAKAGAPKLTGRLGASIGKLATQNKARTSFGSRVGTRLNFTYRTTSGEKMVSGNQKFRSKHAGRKLTTVAAQQYARPIETGSTRDGKWKRAAGGAHFLESSIQRHKAGIITTIGSQLRSYLQSRKG